MGVRTEPVAAGLTSDRPASRALETHYRTIRDLHLRTLFVDDAGRGERLTAEGAGIFLDYSKNRITGGRYSMDSAIGLSTMIAIGAENFRAMLSGFHQMDEHFRTAPFERNLFTQGAIWNINSFDRWGVELGKALAKRIVPGWGARDKPKLAHDSSTNAPIRRYRKLKGMTA